MKLDRDYLTEYFALYGVTPPIREDETTGRYISVALSDAEQDCILESSKANGDIDDLISRASSYFNGQAIYYRRSKWSTASQLIKVDTSKLPCLN